MHLIFTGKHIAIECVHNCTIHNYVRVHGELQTMDVQAIIKGLAGRGRGVSSIGNRQLFESKIPVLVILLISQKHRTFYKDDLQLSSSPKKVKHVK